MSKLTCVKGLSADLNNSSLIDGQILFTTDTGELYIDFLDGETNKLIRKPVTNKNLRDLLQKHIENLNKVENKSSEDIRNEITYDNIINALGFTPSSDNNSIPTFSADAETIEAGLNAEVISIEDEINNELKLVFRIPKGDKGDKGDNANLDSISFSDDASVIYNNLTNANNGAAEAIQGITNGSSLSVLLNRIKRGLAYMLQGLKHLNTNIGAIKGITTSTINNTTGYALDSTAINNFIVTELVSNSSTITLTGGSGNIVLKAPVKTGYTLLGMLEYSCGSSVCFPWRVMLYGGHSAYIGVRRYTGTGDIVINPGEAHVIFLYVRTS